MGIANIFIYTLIIFFILGSTCIFIIAPQIAVVKPVLESILINPNDGQSTKKCLSEIVSCVSDTDCKTACIENSEGIEMQCTTVPRYSGQQTLYGQTQNICAPVKAVVNCNQKNGGLMTWSGFPDINNMQWACICTSPNIASGPGCALNYDVCQGGTFTWDATNPNSLNPYDSCTCGAGFQKIKDNITKIPKCIPNNLTNFSAKSTQTIYNS